MENSILVERIKARFTYTNTEQSKSLFQKLVYNLTIIQQYIENSLKNQECIYISFNGGKDCTATLIAIKFYLFCKFENLTFSKPESYENFIQNHSNINLNNKVELIYFLQSDTFDEEIQYIVQIAQEQKVKLLVLYANYRQGMHYLINFHNLECIFMGIRQDDKSSGNSRINFSEADLVQTSDGNFPTFQRIYPIYQLNYSEVWMLLLQTKFHYLSLYNKGYSSIGRKTKSLKNEFLKKELLSDYFNLAENETTTKKESTKESKTTLETREDCMRSEENDYLPAFCLKDFESERSFRIGN